MPDNPQLTVDLTDAPGGDEFLTSLFPAEQTVSEPEIQATPETPAAETPVVTPPEPPKVFLKTSTGTVYNTESDAVRGTEVKDATITELRNTIKQLTGQDPLARKRPAQPEVVSYSQNPDRYFEDTEAAVKAGDKRKFAAVTQQLVDETIAARIGPYAPVLAKLAVRDAQDSTPQEVRTFVRSDAFHQVLKEQPTLRSAIRNAENDPRYRWQYNEETGAYDHDALPELYNLAYSAARAKAVPVQSTTVVAPATPTRPTLTPTTVADVRSQVTTEASFATPEGRKAIIDRARARGVENIPF